MMYMIQTQTVDIGHVQKILSCCPYYDSIVNYEYAEGDTLSESLIDWYRELIFSADGNDERQLKLIRAIDKSLSLYVKENKYKRGLEELLSPNDISRDNQISIKQVIKTIILFTNNYEKKEILEISNCKWL